MSQVRIYCGGYRSFFSTSFHYYYYYFLQVNDGSRIPRTYMYTRVQCFNIGVYVLCVWLKRNNKKLQRRLVRAACTGRWTSALSSSYVYYIRITHTEYLFEPLFIYHNILKHIYWAYNILYTSINYTRPRLCAVTVLTSVL